MVGEIRDPETADIAVQAALTGHLVLSSLHANGVFEVIQRFTRLGVDRYALATCLNIVAQLLVRLNCRECRATETVSATQWAGLGFADTVVPHLERGVGWWLPAPASVPMPVVPAVTSALSPLPQLSAAFQKPVRLTRRAAG